jgi:hypothetical protein
MTRRRLILAFCVAVIALGAPWWLTSLQLTESERSLIGSWRHASIVGNGVWTFRPDGRARLDIRSSGALLAGAHLDCHWTANAREITLDMETSRVRRMLRPLLQRFGGHVSSCVSFAIVSRTENQVTVDVPNPGVLQVWTRERRD